MKQCHHSHSADIYYIVNKEVVNREPRRLIPVYTYGSIYKDLLTTYTNFVLINLDISGIYLCIVGNSSLNYVILTKQE